MSILKKLFGIKTRADKTVDPLKVAKGVLMKAAEAGDLQAVKVLLEGLVRDGSPLLEDPDVQKLVCRPDVMEVFMAVMMDHANRLEATNKAKMQRDWASLDRLR